MACFVFPGQGMQQPGMLSDVIERYDIVQVKLQEFSELCGHDMIALHKEGSEENLTDATLSGFVVASGNIAIYTLLKNHGIQPETTAGYSVGQYAALYAAGAMDLPTLVLLLTTRQKCLTLAAEETDSAMLSVIGISQENIETLCSSREQLYIANDNCPNHVTLAYRNQDKDAVIEELRALNPIRLTALHVAGGWHSPFITPYAEPLKNALYEAQFNAPICRVMNNVTGAPFKDVNEIRSDLYNHMFCPVLWRQSIQYLKTNAPAPYIEVGYGDQLSKFILFTDRRANISRTGTVAELEALLQKAAT